MRQPRILILAGTDLAKDGRVLRQIGVLKDHGDVTALARVASDSLDIQQIEVTSAASKSFPRIKKAWRISSLCTGLHSAYFWSDQWTRRFTAAAKQAGVFDIIVANDLETLPVAVKCNTSGRVIFDAHEFYPGQHADSPQGRLLNRHAHALCNKYLNKIDGMMTTSPEMSARYLSDYGIQSIDVPNCPVFHSISTRKTPTSGPIKLIYHGVCREGRGIETAVQATKLLNGQFELYLMFAGNRTKRTEAIAMKGASECNHIHIIPPVHPDAIVPAIAKYDLGLSIISPDTTNRQITTANKFFEAIQARLGIVCSTVKTLSRLTDELGVGVNIQQLTAECLATTLSGLSTNEIDMFKSNADHAAQEYCLNRFAHRISDIVTAA